MPGGERRRGGTADDNTAAEAEAEEASPPSALLRFLRAAAVEAETGEAGCERSPPAPSSSVPQSADRGTGKKKMQPF